MACSYAQARREGADRTGGHAGQDRLGSSKTKEQIVKLPALPRARQSRVAANTILEQRATFLRTLAKGLDVPEDRARVVMPHETAPEDLRDSFLRQRALSWNSFLEKFLQDSFELRLPGAHAVRAQQHASQRLSPMHSEMQSSSTSRSSPTPKRKMNEGLVLHATVPAGGPLIFKQREQPQARNARSINYLPKHALPQGDPKPFFSPQLPRRAIGTKVSLLKSSLRLPALERASTVPVETRFADTMSAPGFLSSTTSTDEALVSNETEVLARSCLFFR